jgi:hypothetical protein
VETVPVILTICLRYRVYNPIKLTLNYADPLQALINPAQTAVNSVVSRLSYTQFMKAKNTGGDIPDQGNTHWVDEFKSECLRELSDLADIHGIRVLSLEIMDRELAGSLGKELEKRAEEVLQTQIKASQIEIQNKIKTEEQRGILEVEKVHALVIKEKADGLYYQTSRAADASLYATLKKAEGAAAGSALETEQEAKNINLLGKAYEGITGRHAQVFHNINFMF